jgi:hypothetical protein
VNEVLETKPPERTWGFTRWRSQPWRVIVLGVVVALVFFMHQTTRDVRLPDGTHIELLGILRNTSFDMQRGGARSRSLVVKYYSAETEPDAMRREAVGLAQYFFSIADDAGVTVLYMEASRPLLTRHLPIVTISRNVRFEKYGVGDWEEVRR